MDTTHLVSYLPFDVSPTDDLCGKTWTTYGNPTVGASGAISGKALQLDGSSYIQHNGSITLGGKDFTISGRVVMNSSAPSYSMMFEATTSKGSNYRLEISRYGTAERFVIWADELWGISPNFTVPTNQSFHLELDYQHSASSLKIFVDGVLVSTVSKTLAAKTFAALTIGANTRGSNKWLGSIDEFQIYDGVALHTANFTPPTAEDYFEQRLALTGSANISLTFDVARIVRNYPKLLEGLAVWLPFDDSTTEDLCGNTWTAYGSPTIGTAGAVDKNALQLDGASYIQHNGSITLGGKDFTISGWVVMNSSAPSYSMMFEATTSKGSNYRLEISRYGTAERFVIWADELWGISLNFTVPTNQSFHLELDYQHSASSLKIFVDGVLVSTVSKTLAAKTFAALTIGANTRNSNKWLGSIDEFQIYDGVALHTENFTPPDAAYYVALKNLLKNEVVICDIQRRLANVVTATADLQRRVINPATVTADIQRRVIKSVAETLDVARRLSNRVQVSFDVSRIVSNAGFISVNQSFDVARKIVKSINFSVDVARAVQKNWRYENAGTADDLITTDGETFIAGDDISYVQTNTGTAFYQTTRAKCFDLPATPEIWLKFDVYFDGSNRWRAYNGGNNGNTGITAQTDNEITYFVNGNEVHAATNAAKKNQLQTVLLHMISGSSDGIVEAWVDGNFIYRYTGNVNQGEDFADIYLQCDGAGTLFSNVIISNAPVGLNDGFQIFTLDVARRVSNVITLDLDVARYVLKPVTVPLIGEHFNHFVPSFSVFAGVTHRIILPTNSKVFLRAKGTGILHVFSDTDPAGVLSSGSLFFHSDIYAELDYCNSVFVELATTVTPVQVMHALMFSLDNSTRIASYALDEAIEFATGGKFWRIAAVISQFIADLNAADSYSDFLQDKCDINLDNADTGAITGSDAGGSVTKTAHSVVPEFVPVNSWGVPVSGSVTTVRGLSVRFPDDIDSLSGSAKFILAGLNSDWILQSLILIEQSFGISFNEANAFTHAIDVDFYSEADGILAYVETDFDYDNNLSLLLCINLFYYADVDTNSEDGISPVAEGFLLDRTIAHEFVHAVMAATIHNFVDLPLWFKEGAAELVHGVDDERKEDIIELLTSRKDDLQAALNDEETSSGTDPYAAGYVFLRYLAKQGQHQSDIANLVIADLLISDGATDSDYNALTDNTRQVFAADIARNLIRSSALVLDVAIRAAVRVAFGIDVARAILAELILFPIDAPPVFNSSRLKAKAPLLKAAPDRSRNTPGLQSFEVNISEQQITEQVKVAGVIPFDIMQKVNGQYLDYHFDMRVEKIQQEGILYRCDCCADIDLLLYTQLNYTIPPSTWRKVGADNSTTDIQTYYPPASAHVQKIAAALGLTPVMQFDNFLSTVLMDENGGVTYADLIRDVFGWSSRVPTMLINCFIRDGKFFVIQRGHESRTVDISNAKCSLPVITKELVRTAWGSTPWSKTQTTEFQHSHWQAGIPDDVTLSGGGSDTQGGGDSDKKQVREVSTSFYGSDYQGYTTYTYDRKGLLVQTYTYVEKDINGISQETHTTVNHGYDDDNTMIYTETFVQSFGAEGDSSSKSIEEKGYTVLPGGEKFLAWEKSTTYQNNESISLSDSDLVDERVTVHSPSRLGQTHTVTIDTNGDIVGSAAGQNTGDDRVTPFARYNAAALGKSLFDSSSNTSSGSSGTWATDTETWETTIHGLALYDSSFPIHNEDKLYQVTQALRQLNRKTQETLTISLYEFPHLFDFNDRIIFNGNEYFLVNNTAMTTPRVFNEQNLTLRRWY